jgi:creatinine amidohydrolase
VKLEDCNWMQVEAYLGRDDRIVVPVGSTEQHAYLSLATDSILAHRVSVEAAEPLGVLVLPAMPFGIAPGFASFPGTVSLQPETLAAVLTDALDTLYGQGFRGFLLVNGHGGNIPVGAPLEQWAQSRVSARVRFHSWWDRRRSERSQSGSIPRLPTPPGSRTSPGRVSQGSTYLGARRRRSPTPRRCASSTRTRSEP